MMLINFISLQINFKENKFLSSSIINITQCYIICKVIFKPYSLKNEDNLFQGRKSPQYIVTQILYAI